MKVYTANELQAIIRRSWELGLRDGRIYGPGYEPEPPKLSEVVNHDYGSSTLSSKLSRINTQKTTET